MNIEDLTKTQLLLLTLLVNFVTSIATGVLTVSLLDQAPPTVIQTVNRIVDHTIEQVTTEVPVIRNVPVEAPSTEDLLTSAIAKAKARTAHMFRTGTDVSIASGFLAPGSRVVVTMGDLPGTIRTELSNAEIVEATETKTEGMLRAYTLSENAVLPQVSGARILTNADLRQGQTVIALSNEGAAVTGIITRLGDYVYTDLPGIPQGAAVVNLSGDVVGISLGDGRLVPGDSITALLAP